MAICERCSVESPKLVYHQWQPGQKCIRMCSRCSKFRNILKNYGLSEEEYLRMESEQNGCCAICGIHGSKAPKPGPGKTCGLVVDHCHTRLKVRALLCHRCNTMVGYCDENPQVLGRMIEYLNKFTK